MRKLTLLLDDDVYEGLYRTAGKGNIGHFVSEKVRPFLVTKKEGRAGGFGMLRHLAHKITPQQETEAARRYFEDRYQRKNQGVRAK